MIMTHRHLLSGLAVTALLAFAGAAQAATDTDSKNFGVQGSVPPLCVGGTVNGGVETFDLGVLINTTTGFLRTDLTAPDKVLAGSFCSARSTIAIAATPMTAQNFTAAAPAGFSRSVDYTATASGWTTTPATFNTAAASNPAATQTRATAFSGPIMVGIAGFGTTGGNTLRMVADTQYRGLVTVTLTAVN
jgi:hypothetical protein